MRKIASLVTSILCIYFIIHCSNSPRYTGKSGSRYKQKKNLKSTSKSNNRFKGISSYYGEDFHGKLTANGEVYDMYGLTAAHKTLPLNTIVRVTNLENNKSLILRINDRGPFVKGRILDCSYGAAKKLDFIKQGKTKVQVDVIEWGDGKYMHHRNLKK